MNPSIRRSLVGTVLLCMACAGVARAEPSPTEVMAAVRESGLPVRSFGFYAREVETASPDAAGNGPSALFSLNAEQPFLLASTTKVVTSLAALDLLGPTHSWPLRAFATGQVVDGRLTGDLVIAGNRHAITAADLGRWFAQMRGEGLTAISGQIVLENVVLIAPAPPSAAPAAPSDGVEAPASNSVWSVVRAGSEDARAYNEGSMLVSIEPGPGERAVVALTPKPIGLVVNNEVMMGGTACNVWVRWGDARDAVDGFPPLWVRGRWDARCPKENVAYVRPLAGMKFAPNVVVPVLPVVPDRAATLAPRGAAMGPGSPATARGVALAASSSPLPPAARDIAALWVEAGGTLKGRVLQTEDRLPQHRSAAQAPKWSSVFAVPIAQVVREINKTSDNLAARSLMLSLSDDDAAPGQSRQSAQRRVRDWLRTQGLVDGDIKVDIGSGQSREERGKPRALVDLLRNAWRTDGAQAFVNSLPIAGVDGTLTNRMRDGAAAGQAFLKTGTLSDTRALAGYVRSRSGKVYAVTAIVNHPDAARARNVLDVFIGWVVKHG
jgi:D-alanyl-D-alanine carboxypeptidase/D-alanyl-D-alanine-endopeptidase (penicillin-binding protein 4)